MQTPTGRPSSERPKKPRAFIDAGQDLFPTLSVHRIAAPSRAVFEKRFLLRREPVVFTDLFAGQEISDVSSLAAARSRLGETKILLEDEYFPNFLKAGFFIRGRPAEEMTLARYLHLAERDRVGRRMCIGISTPAQLLSLFRPPAYCAFQYRNGIQSALFVGTRGNIAHLHFDTDHQHVLLHQVFGKKRVILIPTENAKLLLPLSNFSMMCLESMSEAEKRRFLAYAGGCDFVLRPGETVYIPPLMWHYLEYLGPSMSINLRFGGTKESAIVARRCHPNMHLQNVAARMFQRPRLTGKWLGAYRRIERELGRPSASGFEKYQRMQTLFEGLYAELCPDSVQGMYAVPYRENSERQVRVDIVRGRHYSSA